MPLLKISDDAPPAYRSLVVGVMPLGVGVDNRGTVISEGFRNLTLADAYATGQTYYLHDSSGDPGSRLGLRVAAQCLSLACAHGTHYQHAQHDFAGCFPAQADAPGARWRRITWDE